MTDVIAAGCVELFREAAGLKNSPQGHAMSDAEILAKPIDSFDIDSLTTMEFVMAVEEQFEVELNEKAVNNCATIAELANLVAAVRNV